jgi:hypothetical protein
MSLRRRLAVVLVLGLSALIIAAVAIVHLFVSTNAAGDRAAEADAEAGAQALAERVDPSMLAGPPDGDLRQKLQGTAASVLRPLASAAGGYCNRKGAILAAAGRNGRGEREGASTRRAARRTWSRWRWVIAARRGSSSAPAGTPAGTRQAGPSRWCCWRWPRRRWPASPSTP